MEKIEKEDMMFVMSQAIKALKEVRYVLSMDRIESMDIHLGNVKKDGEREITISLKTKGFRGYPMPDAS